MKYREKKNSRIEYKQKEKQGKKPIVCTLTPYKEEHDGSSLRWGHKKSPTVDGGQRNRCREDQHKRREARTRFGRNTAAGGGEGCLTRWARVTDLQQAEDSKSPEDPNMGTKKQTEKQRKSRWG